MKRTAYVLLLALGTSTSLLKASIGCLDCSWHLAQPFDSKNEHPVQCNCPCEKQYKLSPIRGKCPQCGHERYAQPFIIVGQAAVTKILDPKALEKAGYKQKKKK
jgi:hypothetical protein